jgi:broad specificity phosphatase PhoE
MAIFFLIRHGTCEGLGQRLAGRMPGVRLTEQGRREAAQIGRKVAKSGIAAIYSSPLERTQETAAEMSRQTGLSFAIHAGLNEIDYGDWSGRTFEDLREEDEWRRYNSCRCSALIPGGESMQELCRRVRDTMDALRANHSNDSIALVSHADWIRAAASEYARVSLDVFHNFQVDPASLSILRVEAWGSVIVRWNDTGCWNGIG